MRTSKIKGEKIAASRLELPALPQNRSPERTRRGRADAGAERRPVARRGLGSTRGRSRLVGSADWRAIGTDFAFSFGRSANRLSG